jgi:leader peptidase (prepilin peptidase) / N-methyltransferase
LPAELQIYGPAVACVFGLLIGSFLNVCIYRVPRDLSVVFPRSFCPECGTQIRAYDNVPLLSYLWLRGRCRSCGKSIGVRYPLVEAITAALLTSVVWRYGWSWAALKWAIFECLLMILFWTDVEERILPVEFTFGGAFAGLIFSYFVPLRAELLALFMPQLSPRLLSVTDAVLGAVFFAGVFWAIGKAWSRMTGRDALGLGDVHLLLLIGTFLGFEREVPGLMIGAVSGSLLGTVYVLATRKNFHDFELPFGSFLCLGAAVIPFTR